MRKHEDIKLGPGKWKGRFSIGAVILMLILYTIICYILIDNNNVTAKNEDSGTMKANPSVLVESEEGLPVDIPVPGSENLVDWECGTYYSNITKDKIEAYLQVLDHEGWKSLKAEEQISNVAEGTTLYRFVKEDTLLQLNIQLTEDEHSFGNSILLRVDHGITEEDWNAREAVIGIDEIRDQLQTAVDLKVKEKELPAARQKIVGVFEIYIANSYERLGLRAFAAISDPGFIGCFLVRKGVVSYVEGNLDNTIIADIDQDGSYELVDLYSSWEAGLFKHFLVAYEYQNPISFSSLTEIPVRKYSNCFVPRGDFEKLSLIMRDDEIRLLGDYTDYGAIAVKDQSIVLMSTEHFPYDEWATSYDQSLLTISDKKHPEDPPEVKISIDGIGLDYVVHKTSWDGTSSEFDHTMALEKILAKNAFLPKVFLGSFGTEAPERTIVLNFGDSMPDSIRVTDSILDDSGRQLYGDKWITEQTVKILDSSRVSFGLKQHLSLFLSSNSRDYDRDWRRLFLITCQFGEKECIYALLINTGMNEQLTKISDHDFLICEGSYSRISSNWGLGLSVCSKRLPKSYIIEWQVAEGMIRSWDATSKRPIGITEQHNNYPATYSRDGNRGDIIWNPISFEDSGEVTIRAVIYENAKKKNPIAFDELTLIKLNETWQKKTEEISKL